MKTVLKIFLYLIYCLPKGAQKKVAWALGVFWFRVLKLRRPLVEKHLRMCFPHWNDEQVFLVAEATFLNQAQMIVDFANMLFMPPERILESCTFENRDLLEKALLEKRGVILLGSHLSNGDFGIAALAQSGLDLHLVAKNFKNQGLDQLLYEARHRFGTKTIAPRRSSFDILKALKKNGIVIFVMDQFMGKPLGVPTTFFGIPTGTAVGLALFAEKTRAPVLPCYAYRKDDGSYCVKFEEPIPFEFEGEREESLQKMTQKYTDKLEEVARRYPQQWLWLHRRWKAFQ